MFCTGWAYYRRCKLLNTVYQEVVKKWSASRNKKEFTKIASQIFEISAYFRRSYFWNTFIRNKRSYKTLSRPLVLCQNTGLVLLCSSMLLVFIDERNRSNEIIVTSNKICKGFSGPRNLTRFTAFFCHRCLQQASCYLSATVRWSDYCYFIGYFIRKYFFKQPVLAIGTKFAESKLLEFSVFTRCNCHSSNDCSNWCKRNCFCVTANVSHYHRCLLDW